MLKLEKELPKVVERIEILKSKTDVIFGGKRFYLDEAIKI